MTTSEHPSATIASESIFQHVIVGVDGTEAAFEACRQARRLAQSPPGRSMPSPSSISPMQ